MFRWTSVVLTGLACCLTLPGLNAGTDYGCLPPPPIQDYVKKTVRVEIRGVLSHLMTCQEGPRDPMFPMPNLTLCDYWLVSVGDKTYQLDFQGAKLLCLQAGKLEGKTVIVNGTLDGGLVSVTELKADEGNVQKTTEVEVRGQLQVKLLRCGPGSREWSVAVDGKEYFLSFGNPELARQAGTLVGKTVVLTGVLANNTIAVKTLDAA